MLVTIRKENPMFWLYSNLLSTQSAYYNSDINYKLVNILKPAFFLSVRLIAFKNIIKSSIKTKLKSK